MSASTGSSSLNSNSTLVKTAWTAMVSARRAFNSCSIISRRLRPSGPDLGAVGGGRDQGRLFRGKEQSAATMIVSRAHAKAALTINFGVVPAARAMCEQRLRARLAARSGTEGGWIDQERLSSGGSDLHMRHGHRLAATANNDGGGDHL